MYGAPKPKFADCAQPVGSLVNSEFKKNTIFFVCIINEFSCLKKSFVCLFLNRALVRLRATKEEGLTLGVSLTCW